VPLTTAVKHLRSWHLKSSDPSGPPERLYALDELEPRRGRGSNGQLVDYRAAARAAFTMPAPKKELRLALP
jgi:hypothetical protein